MEKTYKKGTFFIIVGAFICIVYLHTMLIKDINPILYRVVLNMYSLILVPVYVALIKTYLDSRRKSINADLSICLHEGIEEAKVIWRKSALAPKGDFITIINNGQVPFYSMHILLQTNSGGKIRLYVKELIDVKKEICIQVPIIMKEIDEVHVIYELQDEKKVKVFSGDQSGDYKKTIFAEESKLSFGRKEHALYKGDYKELKRYVVDLTK